MRKVYIDGKLPKTCGECNFIGHYENGLYARNPHCCCELYWDLYKEDFRVDKNKRDKKCPLRQISELKDIEIKYNNGQILHSEFSALENKIRQDERKEICEQIYKLFTNESMWKSMKDWWLNNGNCRELKQVLDAVENGMKNKEIIEKFSKDREYYALFNKLKEENNE